MRDIIRGGVSPYPRHCQVAARHTTGARVLRLEASQPRRVPDDYLVSFETNRYSVPFSLIGQTVDVARRQGRLVITHRGQRVAEHPELPGKHQARVLPEPGSGAIARTGGRRAMPGVGDRTPSALDPDVEIRALAIYETLAAVTA